MSTWFPILMILLMNLPVAVLLAFTPYLTRKTESFGVTIPEEVFEQEEIKAMRVDYRNKTLAVGIIISAISLLAAGGAPMYLSLKDNMMVTSAVMPFGIVLELLLSFLFYLPKHKAMKALKNKYKWTEKYPQKVVVDTEFRKKKILVSPWWFLMNVFMIGATILLVFLMYDKAPDRIPMHYDIYGNVNRWETKSYKTLFFPVTMQVFMCGLMVMIYWMIGRVRQQVDAARPEESLERNRVFRYRWSGYMVFMSWMMTGLFGFMELSLLGFVKDPNVIMMVVMTITAVILVASFVLAITTGQGGSRLKVVIDQAGNVISRDEDKYWKMGMFYYNPNDPSWFVEKRFGIGWTNNFAHPATWIFLVAVIAIPIIISIFFTK